MLSLRFALCSTEQFLKVWGFVQHLEIASPLSRKTIQAHLSQLKAVRSLKLGFTHLATDPHLDEFIVLVLQNLGPKLRVFEAATFLIRAQIVKDAFQLLDEHTLEHLHLCCSAAIEPMQLLLSRGCLSLRALSVPPDAKIFNLLSKLHAKLTYLTIDSTNFVLGKTVLLLPTIDRIAAANKHLLINIRVLQNGPFFSQLLKDVGGDWGQLDAAILATLGLPMHRLLVNDNAVWLAALLSSKPPSFEQLKRMVHLCHVDAETTAEALGRAIRSIIRSQSATDISDAPALVEFFTSQVQEYVVMDGSSSAVFACAALVGLQEEYRANKASAESQAMLRTAIAEMESQFFYKRDQEDPLALWDHKLGLSDLLDRCKKYLRKSQRFWAK